MPLDGQTLGHYRLQRLIGRGGMGEVYLAEDTRLARQLAVKVIQTEQAPHSDEQETQDAARLFQREMKAIVALDHPHVLPLYDFGETTIDNLLIAYIVMPYRAEGSLDDWLKRRETADPLSPQETSRLVSQAADALRHAHEHNLVHQDVKPPNFLVRNRAENWSQPDILLTDFGVAKFTTATATASQNVRGTPAYMAPEQWEGEPVAATDQYALAVMAYSLLTGRPPFVGRMEQVMRQHFNATPQPPSTFNAQIPPALDAVLLHALEKQPEKRFATITHFANAFKQAALQEATASVVSQSKQAQPSGTQSVPRTLPDGLPPTVYQSKPEQKPLEPTVPVLEPNGFVAEKADAAAATSSFPSKSLPPAPQSKSRSHMRTFVLIGLVLGIILASAASFFVYHYRVAQQSSDATATQQALSTANPYPSYMPGQGTFAFYDPLNSENYWHPNDTCQFTPDGYVISSSQPSFTHCDATTSPTFSNFAFEVQMTITQGDCGSVLFRGDYTNSNFYSLRICQKELGSYKLNRCINNCISGSNSQYLAGDDSPKFSTKVGYGQPNTIGIVCDDIGITFYLNSKKIATVGENFYTSGQVGLAAKSVNNATQVSFKDARMWTL